MKNKITNMLTSLIIMTFAVTTNVQADTSKFTGFGVGLSGSFVGGDTELSVTGANLNVGENDTVFGIDANYSFPVDGKFFIAVGATYDLDKTKFGSANDGTDTIKYSMDDHYSLYIQPSIAVSTNTAVFAKLGYHEAEGKITVTSGTTYGGSATQDFKGWGYGLGIKTILSNNFYIQAEAGLIDYDKETADGVSYKPEAVVGTITVGYKY
jgi:hypothetical protein